MAADALSEIVVRARHLVDLVNAPQSAPVSMENLRSAAAELEPLLTRYEIGLGIRPING